MQPTPPLTPDPVLEGYPGAQVAKHEAVRHLHMLTALAGVLHAGQQDHWDQDQLDAAQQELARAYRKLGEPDSQDPVSFSQALPCAGFHGSASSVLAPYAAALLPTYPRHLLRLMLLDYLPLYRQTVAELTLTVLGKMPLAINRPLYTRSGGAVLAATPLLALGQNLAAVEGKIADTIVELDSFGVAPCSHYEPFEGFHQSMAEGLGFTRLSHEQLSRELPIWRALKLQLDTVLAEAEELTAEAKPLCGQAYTEAAESAISEAASYLQGAEKALATLDLEGAAGAFPVPSAAYMQRVHLGQQLHGGLVSLRQLDIAMREFYSSGTAEDPVAPPAWFVWRPFTQFLIAQGVEAVTAIEQCAEVRAYCEKKSVHPKDLAAEELRVIQPELKQAAQEFFQISTDGFLDGKNQGSTRKEAIMTQSQHLIQTVSGRPSATKSSSFLSSLLLLVTVVGIMLPGCGVKTAPRADTDNLRPSLPFKPRAIKSSATKSSATMPRAAISEKGTHQKTTKPSKAKSP